MKERFNHVFNNENGSPMVESVIAIFVSICVIGGMVFVGHFLIKYIGNATSSVVSLQ